MYLLEPLSYVERLLLAVLLIRDLRKCTASTLGLLQALLNMQILAQLFAACFGVSFSVLYLACTRAM